ncbi:MAG: hypothetical protein BGO12_12520 [Verrucomicrobia bacterium 61-8]|nr:MAG: hypothetical protein BGO12_12520 [Verrucomicrobia bacterium 61-8]
MNRLFRRIEEKARDVSQPPVTIVAFGDSVTQGVMEHRVLDSAHVYHRLLLDHLESFFPTTSFSIFNAGVSGDSAANALGRLDRDVLSRNPDLVLIAFGLNDSLQGEPGLSGFSSSLAAMIRIIKEKTRSAMLVLTPPFMARKPGPRIHPDHLSIADRIMEAQNTGMLARYASAIRRVAGQHDVPLADVHREWERLAESGLDTDVWLINGLNHPDARGHRLAALLVFHALLSCR